MAALQGTLKFTSTASHGFREDSKVVVRKFPGCELLHARSQEVFSDDKSLDKLV